MELLTRLAGIGLDVLDAWPRRRLPVVVGLVVLAVAMLWPGWVVDVIAARFQPIIDGVVEVLGERNG